MLLKPRLFRKPRKGHWATKGLVYFPLMNEGSGSQVFDLSGNGNTGVVTGALWKSGQFGSSLWHDGSGDYTTVQDKSSIRFSTGDFALSSWIKTTQSHTGVIFAKGDITSNSIAYQLYTRTTDPYVRLYTRTGGALTSQTSSMPTNIHDGQWHHIFVQRKSGNLQIYIDGILRSDESLTIRDVSNTEPLYIGRRIDNTAESLPFQGYLDVPMMYNRALSPSEIALLYREPFCMFERDPIELWSAATLGVGGEVKEIVGTIASQSAVTGVLSVSRSVTGTITTDSTVTGTLDVNYGIAGTVTTACSVTGSLKVSRKVIGTVTAVCTVTGRLSVSIPIVGAIAGSNTVTGVLKVRRELVGTITTSSTVTGILVLPGNYGENKLLEHIVGKTSFSIPTVYLGLSTADPLDDGSGLAEPSGNGYARLATVGKWTTASNGIIQNGSAMSFPAATGAWGTITHYALFDAPSGGNILLADELDTPYAIVDENIVSFTVGGLEIHLN